MSIDLREFAAETTPGGSCERVLERVMESVPEAARCGALIREIPDGGDAAVERVMARLESAALAPRRARPTGWPLLWLPVAATAAAAMSAVAWVATGPAEQPGAVDVPEVVAELIPLDAALDAETESVYASIEGVRVAYVGTGHVSGTAEAPVIHLSRGHVRVEVDPEQGVALEVRTEEGTVRVLGTVFTVDRDALGTRVHVERGRVGVACADGAASELALDEEGSCLPATASGLLGRALRLTQDGAPLEAVLEAADRGQAAATAGDFDWRELQALRVQALLQAGDAPAACEAARAWPSLEEDPRAAELARLLESPLCDDG